MCCFIIFPKDIIRDNGMINGETDKQNQRMTQKQRMVDIGRDPWMPPGPTLCSSKTPLPFWATCASAPSRYSKMLPDVQTECPAFKFVFIVSRYSEKNLALLSLHSPCFSTVLLNNAAWKTGRLLDMWTVKHIILHTTNH